MVYPETELPVVVEIRPAGIWVDVTEDVRLADGITIEEGRGDWGERVDAGKISATFDNQSGDYSEVNPLGQWYGQLGRDTELRVRIRRGEDAFGRTTSNGWGTSDSGQTWSALGGSASDFSIVAGSARHSHGTINALRNTILDVNLVDTEQLVDASTSALLTGAALVTGAMARYIDGNNYYWLRTEFNASGTAVMLKITKRVAGVETELAVLNPVPSLAYAAGVPLRTRASVVGSQLAMKVWPASDPEPADWMLEATDTGLTEPGQVGIQTWVVSGNSNALPLVASFANYKLHVDLAAGRVPAWVPRWDKSGVDRTVPVVARGELYRMQTGSGKPPAHSPMRRFIPAIDPALLLGYWPLEDAPDSTQAASGLPGGTPMVASGTVGFGEFEVNQSEGGTTRYGTAPLPDFSAGGALFGGTARAGVSSPVAWTVQFMGAQDTWDGVTAEPEYVFLSWRAGSALWEIVLSGTPDQDTILRVDGVERLRDTSRFSGPHEWRVETWTDGVTIATQLYISGDTQGDITPGGAGPWTATWAGTLGWPTDFAVNTGRAVTAPLRNWIGHLQAWDGLTAPQLRPLTADPYGLTVNSIWSAYRGEAAHLRMARLIAEDGITVDTPVVAEADITRMGVQPDGIPRDLYAECEDADGGVLYERPLGLAFQPQAARFNQTPAMVLDITAGDLSEAPQADPERQDYRNRQKVERPGGSSATAETPEVTAGEAVVYEDSAKANVVFDTQLADKAAWKLYLTSNTALRWPKLQLDLASTRGVDLIDQWLNCRVGSRITAVNPPADVAGVDIDVHLEGHTTYLGFKDWNVSANCSPAGPWAVGTADGDQRAPADGSTLSSALAGGGMSFLLASTTENGVWTTDAADFPLSVRVGGEKVTASAIASSVRDTFTRTTSNGWGTSDSSHAWTIGLGTASDFSTNGSQGLISLSAINAERHITTDLGSTDIQDMRLWLTLPVTPTGAQINWGILLRYVDSNNYCWADVQVGTDSSLTLRLIKRVAGTATQLTTLVSGVTHSTSVPRVLRASVDGDTLRGKVWSSDTTEPDWQLTTSDSSLPAGSLGGAVARLMTGNANTGPVQFRFDNLAVLNPQTVTLSARGVNGVTRAWPAGTTEVDVWEPAISSL